MKVSAPFEPAICVRDLDRALAFYRDVLGMSVFSLDEVTAEEASRAGLSTQGYRIARIETGGGDRLKLAQPQAQARDGTPQDTVLGRYGFAYLTYIVPDLADVLRRVAAAGGRVRTGAQTVSFRPGVDLIFAEDPDGNVLEFVQRNDLAKYRPGR